MKSIAVVASLIFGQVEIPQALPVRPPTPPNMLDVPGGIVAIVADEPITQDALEEASSLRRSEPLQQASQAAIDREYARFQWLVLESLVDDTIILQLVKKEEKKAERPYATDADIDRHIEGQVRTLKKEGQPVNTPEDLYRLARLKNNRTREQYRHDVRKRLSINNYLMLHVFRADDGFVSPADARYYYERHADEFTTPVTISFRQIVLTLTRDHSLEIATRLIEEGLKAGKDFVTVKRELHQLEGETDERLVNKIWVRPFDELREWLPPIADVLRGMKKGEVSARVATIQDVRYFKVEDVEEGEPVPFMEAQRYIERRLRSDRRNNRLRNWLKHQRKKTRIEYFLQPLPEG